MNRQENTPITQDNKTKRRYYLTTALTEIERSDTDIYINVRKGDRLDLLATIYYGNATDWWIIALANGLGKGSIVISKNMQIRIPMNLSKIKQDLKNNNIRK